FAEIQQIAGQIEDAEREFERLGGMYAETRHQTQSELAQARNQLDYLVSEMRRAFGDSMPFLHVAPLLKRAQLQIEKEQKNRSIRQAAKLIALERDNLAGRLAQHRTEAE